MSGQRVVALAAWATLLLVPGLGACGGTLLDASERDVVTRDAGRTWRPAAPEDVPGFWLSETISGEAAGALLMIAYYFTEEGSFSGAALAFGEGGQPAFQSLSGSWTCREGTLHLEPGGDAVTIEQAPGHLRLGTSSGSVVLRREPLR